MERNGLSGFAIRSRRVVTPEGVRSASVHVEDGRIARVSAWDDAPRAVVDVGDFAVMPGIVDTHVHVNEPGRTDWEGFATATRAAAAGGVTTLLDMPLNSIPATTSVAALETKRRALAESDAVPVNVEFIGGVVPRNTGEIAPLVAAGVRAFKCFMSPSGVDEFRHESVAGLREAFPVLARHGLPLMVHAEDPAKLRDAPPSRQYADYLASRPVAAEQSAIESLVRLLGECTTPVHVVHLSSASSLDIIDRARTRGLPITVETCPHYLTFAAEEIPDGATEYKCAPPIRGGAERDALWRALLDGRIDLVASDHSPCPPAMKRTGGDFAAAWGGIASLELSLAAVWTGARARGAGVERIAEWMSAGPAKLAGLHERKGQIAAGFDADLVVWDPDAAFVVDPARLKQRHPVTPYAGRELYGIVHRTYVGGVMVHHVH